MKVSGDDYLAHYGILRKSGRYPWGSGANPNQRSKTFMDIVDKHKKEDGMSEAEIAKAHGMTMNELRATKSLAVNQIRQDKIRQADRLAEKGMSTSAIARRMNLNESSVRTLRAPGAKDKADVLQATANMLKRQVDEKGAIDIGTQVERALPIGENPAQLVGISKEKLGTAVALLREQGYKVHTVRGMQLGTGNLTTYKVLARPDVKWNDLRKDPSLIKPIAEKTDDGGRSYTSPWRRPQSVSSKRIQIAYDEDGGSTKDGLIELRPGVKDLNMGKSNYAQVRIVVDSSHYLKGMAVYNPDLPNGVDIRFNTNKSKKDTKKMDAMKEVEKKQNGKPDLDQPFTSAIKLDGQRGALNIVNEKGDWENHSKNLPSQMLSKQTPHMIKTQLDLTQDRRRKELDSILDLTNPTVKRRLLEAYADETDAAAVHLKAASRPRQSTKVLLPVDSVKAHEIYAPALRDGERVSLVRFPHGGTFEIPQLTVNNRNPEARKILGNRALDAVGINHKVAERLSGADFDGDTALIIPTKGKEITSTPALKGLEGFDPRGKYRVDPKVRKTITENKKQQEMGYISNLITDMTLKGANNEELARAVRHSMVVIDSEKHNLDHKASKRDNGIEQLYKKYQPDRGTRGGASTLISRASGRKDVPHRKGRPAKEGGPIDKRTGEKKYVETGKVYRTGPNQGKPVYIRSKKLIESNDAHTLSSGTERERLYADHSNKLKSMSNEARKVMVNTKPNPYSKDAKKVYHKEVESLDKQLDVALRNAPRERQAQAVANAMVSQRRAARPDADDDEIKKIKRQSLEEARRRTGADKTRISLTQTEWNAIQSGAISNNKLEQILRNADLDSVRKLATPKQKILMSSAKAARAQAMLSQGYTQAEVADALGVALSTLKLSLNE